jgi:hypothetical protein
MMESITTPANTKRSTMPMQCICFNIKLSCKIAWQGQAETQGRIGQKQGSFLAEAWGWLS